MEYKKYSPELEKTKQALVSAYSRLASVHEDIELFNTEDNFDELEFALSKREALFERIEYLRARVQPEAEGFLKQRVEDLPGEIADLNTKLAQHKKALNEKARKEVVDFLTILFDLGMQQTGGATVKFPDGFSKFIVQAKNNSGKSDCGNMRKEIQAKKSELNKRGNMMGFCDRIDSQARTIATEENGFDLVTHFLTPYRKRNRR